MTPIHNNIMDFKDSIKQLSERVLKLKDNLQTEEATKTALIMPFIQMLGYDVFNPLEVMPEYTCDIGTKKGEKIDYAIIKEDSPIILIECKHWKQDLTLHDNQLLRYFHVSNAKFGILTNGIIYRFYTDLETPNKMDEKPFLEIDLLDIKHPDIEEVKKFHKTYFDLENILSSANELKYTRELKCLVNSEFQNPSTDFVKLFAKQVYDGLLTQKMLEQFTVKKYTTMKQILLLSITMFMLTACVSRRPYTEDSYTISYSDHKDIFITESNSVNFEYEPIGSVSATIGSGYKGRKFIEATEDEVIKKLCKESKLLGANGIINFRITYSVDNRYTKPNPAIIITATGMAIKF